MVNIQSKGDKKYTHWIENYYKNEVLEDGEKYPVTRCQRARFVATGKTIWNMLSYIIYESAKPIHFFCVCVSSFYSNACLHFKWIWSRAGLL